MSKRTVVLVTGSREHQDKQMVWAILAQFPNDTLFMHGDCPTGVDLFVKEWCGGFIKQIDGIYVSTKLEHREPADWDRYHKAAGPKRNQLMVDLCKVYEKHGFQVIVEAFPLPGSKGTRNCMKLAEKAGLKVLSWGA